MVSASHRRSEGCDLITAWESEMFKELHYNNESLPCSLKTASSRQLFTVLRHYGMLMQNKYPV